SLQRMVFLSAAANRHLVELGTSKIPASPATSVADPLTPIPDLTLVLQNCVTVRPSLLGLQADTRRVSVREVAQVVSTTSLSTQALVKVAHSVTLKVQAISVVSLAGLSSTV